MTDHAETLRKLLAESDPPPCAALTPYRIVAADFDAGRVELEFEAQPAFGNHFNAIQGGFAVAMLDASVAIVAFAGLREWLPTVEIKTSFLNPIPIAPCRVESRVLKAGKQVVFVEARLLVGGTIAASATATLVRTGARAGN